ncbi:MAG: hypothetical protein AB1814_06805 [Thermodesulfobacteriota bacterium]
MVDESKDVVDILKQQESHHKKRLAYHQDQIARIQKAISALCDESSPSLAGLLREVVEQDAYPWSESISEIAQRLGQFKLAEMRKHLAEAGLPAMDDKYYGVIQGTLSRKVSSGELKRVKKGFYEVVVKKEPEK